MCSCYLSSEAEAEAEGRGSGIWAYPGTLSPTSCLGGGYWDVAQWEGPVSISSTADKQTKTKSFMAVVNSAVVKMWMRVSLRKPSLVLLYKYPDMRLLDYVVVLTFEKLLCCHRLSFFFFNSPRKLLKADKFSSVAGYKINLEKTVAYLSVLSFLTLLSFPFLPFPSLLTDVA